MRIRWRDEDPGSRSSSARARTPSTTRSRSRPLPAERSDGPARRATERAPAGDDPREFLLSACGAATTLLVARRVHAGGGPRAGRPRATPGGRLPDPAGGDDRARGGRTRSLGGEEFVFDIQGHLLEYDLNPVLNGQDFWHRFPQQSCGEDDPRVCYSIEHFLELMFLRSRHDRCSCSRRSRSTRRAVPLSPEIMDETRRIAEGLCRDERVLLHAQALPNVGPLGSTLDAMEDIVGRYPIARLEDVHALPRLLRADGKRAGGSTTTSPSCPQVGERVHPARASSSASRRSARTRASAGGSRYASPARHRPGRARASRRHASSSTTRASRPRVPGGPVHARRPRRRASNRLITSMQRRGRSAPNENVYAELGSTWWYVMRDADQAAHVLGKLLKHVGEDNVVWGTDSICYGSPQDQIQAFRAFQISERVPGAVRLPGLTRRMQGQDPRANAARLYGMEPITSEVRVHPARAGTASAPSRAGTGPSALDGRRGKRLPGPPQGWPSRAGTVWGPRHQLPFLCGGERIEPPTPAVRRGLSYTPVPGQPSKAQPRYWPRRMPGCGRAQRAPELDLHDGDGQVAPGLPRSGSGPRLSFIVMASAG